MVSRPKFESKAGKKMPEDFNLREIKIEPPDVYLGVTLSKMKLESVKGTYTDQHF